MTTTETTERIARCEECGHPWAMHSFDGCGVGTEAPVAERCRCLRPVPVLLNEDIDTALKRLGEPSKAETRRLLYGSHTLEHLVERVDARLYDVARYLEELGCEVSEFEDALDDWDAERPAGADDAKSALARGCCRRSDKPCGTPQRRSRRCGKSTSTATTTSGTADPITLKGHDGLRSLDQCRKLDLHAQGVEQLEAPDAGAVPPAAAGERVLDR